MSEKDFVQVAKLGKTVGLKGYIKLYNLSDFSSQFKKDASFFIENGKKILKIKHYNANNSTVLFQNYEDIQKAKELINMILFQSIEQSRQTCKLKKDEFFYFDILECEVFDEHIKLGKVINILEIGTSYLLEVQSDEKWVEKKYSQKFFIPYLNKFIKSVNIQKREIFCTKDAFLILENS
ncbi:ribosome maturation factor RimM [Campylobacter hepaticus]|uniref:Ribosome maturation factor RimM n=1 Tax=Campylobacter hepaticus TaxID=1813019 RepID=A0A424Z009_9BACT|nr:ribosome maturation factor RimM [Campylobacter hepaticus]AXP08705.1 16S rRNA processing protein RimM [Campylobacter hepaticus]MCZ0772553.1 ribosome maturation factor RimM [Campylobacter hepaticus]MCZ0774021.1 ribosome maturation factor RimM [Campylobacter hepaticus]MCZ0775273.1 ribosome maturation factor RimM [Campylobacter hepaticus]MDX2322985.1 ribosome maturation factor RimM [Campylobacter hepaticus]